MFVLLQIIPGRNLAQELEPRVYAALPKDLNYLVVAYGFLQGNVLTDPTAAIKGLKINAHNLAAVYGRTFAFAGKLARVQFTFPYVFLSGSARINGVDTAVTRDGFGDARIRFGINLTGTPVLGKKEFRGYTQKTIIGVSLVTSLPIGLYLPDKRVNIGNNRWGFKPEVGVSKLLGRVYLEAYTGVWFFTRNNQYQVNKSLQQRPVFGLQAHAAYYFKNQMWVSMNTTWFQGGESVVNDVPTGEKLDNWRIGGTWSFPIARGHSLRLQAHAGAFTSSGYDYNTVSLAYQYIF